MQRVNRLPGQSIRSQRNRYATVLQTDFVSTPFRIGPAGRTWAVPGAKRALLQKIDAAFTGSSDGRGDEIVATARAAPYPE